MRAPRLLALAAATATLAALPAAASAQTVRTPTTPDQLRAGKAAYDKAITAGYAKATKLLDAALKQHPKKPTVVLDIDETTLSNWSCLDAADFALTGLATCVISSTSQAFPAAKTFIKHAKAKHVAIAFITGAPDAVCPARKKNLLAQGIPSGFTITCKPASYTTDSLVPYKSGARKAIVKSGRRILLNVGDQKSDLAGGAADKTVLLPNPIYTTN
jgi:predicted secreted acid phosphatase